MAMPVLFNRRLFDLPGDVVMENLDLFFEAYDRLLPRYFSEVAVAALLFGSVAFFTL
jgi:hypothetical protein